MSCELPSLCTTKSRKPESHIGKEGTLPFRFLPRQNCHSRGPLWQIEIANREHVKAADIKGGRDGGSGPLPLGRALASLTFLAMHSVRRPSLAYKSRCLCVQARIFLTLFSTAVSVTVKRSGSPMRSRIDSWGSPSLAPKAAEEQSPHGPPQEQGVLPAGRVPGKVSLNCWLPIARHQKPD